jgi:hypothetical protein
MKNVARRRRLDCSCGDERSGILTCPTLVYDLVRLSAI